MAAALRFASCTLAALALGAAASAAHAQGRIHCESRNYSYSFCPAGSAIDGVFLVEQRSRSACIQGQTWGWDRRGVWVDRGCEGVFDVRASPPPPVMRPDGGALVGCESRNYQYEFCALPEGVVHVALVNQRSQASCIEGRTWGWRENGIWVNAGCGADFQVRTSFGAPAAAPPPSTQGLLYCESRDFRYTFCPTGRLRVAQLVNQRSQSTCVYGQSWGYQNDGIWVDRGCAAEFAVQSY